LFLEDVFGFSDPEKLVKLPAQALPDAGGA
jgi:hypothetical protein